MKINLRIGTGVVCILGIIAAYWLGVAVTQARGDQSHAHPDGPPRPAWVRADGTVDVGAMPDCIPALNARGDTLVDAAGKQVCISKHDLVGPPASAPNGKNPDEISREVRPDGSEHVTAGKAKRHDQ